LATVFASAALAQQVILRPGQYERTTEVTMTGRGKLSPRTESQCITAEDVGKFWNALQTRRDQNCTRSDYKQTEKSSSYTQICQAGDSTMTSRVNVTFTSAESFQAVIEMNSTGQAAAAASPLLQGATTMTVTGKRVGDCKK
jgi:hypothetical protein